MVVLHSLFLLKLYSSMKLRKIALVTDLLVCKNMLLPIKLSIRILMKIIQIIYHLQTSSNKPSKTPIKLFLVPIWKRKQKKILHYCVLSLFASTIKESSAVFKRNCEFTFYFDFDVFIGQRNRKARQIKRPKKIFLLVCSL